jgi:hypothetical protein
VSLEDIRGRVTRYNEALVLAEMGSLGTVALLNAIRELRTHAPGDTVELLRLLDEENRKNKT